MRLTRIYIDQPLSLNTTIELDKPAAHHLTRVLRLRNNDPFIIFNGKGGEYQARLIPDNRKTFASIDSFNDIDTSSSIEITLLQCISKGDRMDFAIQKATELGVSCIVPICSEFTAVNLKDDRRDKKLHHWQSIAINACEQSGRSELPVIKDIVSYKQLMAENMDGTKLMLDPISTNTFSSLSTDENHFFLLIGPEGGLSEDEVQLAKLNGFTGIQMGKRILRTETAALAGITAIQTLCGDFKL